MWLDDYSQVVHYFLQILCHKGEKWVGDQDMGMFWEFLRNKPNWRLWENYSHMWLLQQFMLRIFPIMVWKKFQASKGIVIGTQQPHNQMFKLIQEKAKGRWYRIKSWNKGKDIMLGEWDKLPTLFDKDKEDAWMLRKREMWRGFGILRLSIVLLIVMFKSFRRNLNPIALLITQ